MRYYLGDGLRWADALGPVADPRVFDWRDALDALQARGPLPRGAAGAAAAAPRRSTCC